MYKRLFQEIKIRNTVIKNRVVMAPMATRYASFNGEVTERLISYYKERAKGGVGLINIEATAISHEGIGWRNNLAIYDDRYIPGLKKLTAALHQYGAKVSVEIFHSGREANPSLIAQQPLAPSAIHDSDISSPRELEVEEIKELVLKFGAAARRAKEAGFDVVNLHMAHGYLINQFLSPLTNRRTDEYGGSTENRTKFAVEVLQEVRKQVGEEFPIFCRLTAEEGIGRAGIDVSESTKIAPILEAAGADVIDISAGAADKPYLTEGTYSIEPGYILYVAKAIREVVDIPITIVGKIKTPEMAEDILEKGIADFVVLGRGLIADPYWPEKAKDNRIQDIVPCTSCLQGCGRLGKGLEISCTVNPAMGREGMFADKCCKESKRILVVGGGISGMYAASELAKQGHTVTLVEKENCLGGQGNLAAVPHHKTRDLEPMLAYLKRQLDQNGVEVHMNEELTEDKIREINPEIIIQATGAKPRFIEIPGMENVNVLSAWEVLREKECPGNTIAVIGAGEVGLETAEYISKLGKRVYVFEALSDFGNDMRVWEKRFLLERLENTNIEIFTQAKLSRMEGSSLYFELGGLEEVVHGIDTIVMSVGSQPNPSEALVGIDIPVYSIGDCTTPKRMYEAFHSGYMLKYKI